MIKKEQNFYKDCYYIKKKYPYQTNKQYRILHEKYPNLLILYDFFYLENVGAVKIR